MKAFIEVCRKFKKHPALIFIEAYHYWEMRTHQQNMATVFLTCGYIDERGDFYMEEVPDFVEIYCVNVLMKDAIPLTKTKLLGDGNDLPEGKRPPPTSKK